MALRNGFRCSVLPSVVIEALAQSSNGDLEVIAEHAVVADFQVFHPGALAFAALEVQEPLPTIGRMGAQVVELGNPPRPDNAVTEVERRRLHEAGYEIEKVLTTDDLVRGDDVFVAATGVTSGALLRGVVVVPMDRTAAPEFAARVFQQVSAKLLVSSRGLTLPLATSTLHFEDFPSLPPGQIDTVESSRDDPVQIVFTSGTTGEPKGVVITHGNILANLEPIEGEIQKYLRYERIFHPLRFLNLLPLSHVFGQFMGIFIPPLIGATVTFLESIKPSDIVNSIRAERISVLVIVPRLLGSLREMIEAEMAQRLGTSKAQEQMQNIRHSDAPSIIAASK